MPEIFEATPADADEIIALQRLAYQSEAILYNDWSLPALTQTPLSLKQEFAHSVILKTSVNNRIIGSVRASAEGKTCKIGRLIVHPDHQRRGIGSSLLTRIEQLHSDAHQFELFTGSKSLSNIRLYEGRGYTISHSQALSENLSITFLIKPNAAH
jgi:GNAT superfamily N-acetyltransferase